MKMCIRDSQDTALHDQAAGLAVGSGQTGLDHEGQNADGAIGQIRFGQLSRCV